jgi:two-component system phosphate regulon sensor histidine kinase PhoR
MNKRIISGLVLLMGISLLGIVAVQIYWFNNSVKVRNELFDRSVNDAMNKTVGRLETGYDLKIIKKLNEKNDSSKLDFNNFIPPPQPPPPPIQGSADIEVTIKKDTNNGRIRVIASKRGVRKSLNYNDIYNDTIAFNHTSSKGQSMQTYITFADTVFVSGNQETGTKVEEKIDQLKKLSNRIKIEYNSWETGRYIDEQQLHKFLTEELAEKAIPILFKYSINTADSINNQFRETTAKGKVYKVNLFPNDIFRKNIGLAVFFPERDQFIGRTTTQLLALSTVFTLIIFITFSLSIYLIIKQKKISEMKSDFINNMTHEFKTPIATISIAADSISNDRVINDGEKVRFFAGMIKKENSRMNEQVERILQIARFDKKEFEFNFQAVDLHILIQEVIKSIFIQVEKRGGKIETRLEANNRVVTTDPIHFTNLVFNLLDNANKYSSDTPQIIVSTYNVPKGINLSIEDHGIGMTKAVQSRIFDKFYRLPTGNIHNTKGFGLGLSYVKAILEANGGNIKVFSELGKGSRFVVFVPFLINRR